MNEFEYELENGETIIVEFEPVDYDDSGNIEFEISAFKDGKEIWDELSSSDQHQIETQAKNAWQQICKDSEDDAAIHEFLSNNY
jgi:hypothetical protein